MKHQPGVAAMAQQLKHALEDVERLRKERDEARRLAAFFHDHNHPIATVCGSCEVVEPWRDSKLGDVRGWSEARRCEGQNCRWYLDGICQKEEDGTSPTPVMERMAEAMQAMHKRAVEQQNAPESPEPAPKEGVSFEDL